MVATLLLLTLLAIATVTDLLRHKIYNWTTYPGILAGVTWNALGSLLLDAGQLTEEELQSAGWVGVGASAGGLALCGGILLVCFVLFHVSGGDVKLMAMIGAVVGWERGLEAMLWTFVLGACMGLIVLIWRVGPWTLLVRGLRQLLWTLRLGGWSPLTETERAQLQTPLFLAPAALVAVVIVQFSLVEWF